MPKIVWSSLALILGQCLWADVTLPKILDHHMVLQRQTIVPVWGLAEGGENVEVQFAGQSKKTVADANGRWEIRLDPMEANSSPQTMNIKGNNEIRLEDVLVGEVWLASGQSNMEWTLNSIAPEEKKSADELLAKTKVRVFKVPPSRITSLIPLDDTIGQWKLQASLVSNKNYSAVAYFFAEKLQQELGIPVAILDSNWGGRPIESFISDDGYEMVGLKSQKISSEKLQSKILEMKQNLERLKNTISLAEKNVYLPIDSQQFSWGDASNGIYNAMIAPLAPFALKGAIWYQGESNRGKSDYFDKLKALSAGWSKAFRVKDIPLYQAQIAPYNYERKTNSEATTICDSIWNAQYKGAEEIPGMGVVPIHDTNIPINDIHPPYKRTVGERMASLALKRLYGKDVVATSPKFSAAQIKGNKVVVSFKDCVGELSTNDGKAPSWFEISADGKTFVTATATLKGSVVEVDVPQNFTPVAVRMGWREIALPNLQDSKTGWPVFAFAAQEIIK